jgi:hypothetical protein
MLGRASAELTRAPQETCPRTATDHPTFFNSLVLADRDRSSSDALWPEMRLKRTV